MRRINQFRKSFEHFCAGKGFALLTTLCVAVIAATALFTKRTPVPEVRVTPPLGNNYPAAALWQQTLPAATPTPLPTSQPILWQSPLPDLQVLQAFTGTQMTASGVTGIWAVHHAVDLAAQAGTPVSAIAPGRVLDCGSTGIDGTWITLEHTGGYISRYASLGLLGAFRPGDTVNTGQTIGFVGNTAVSESDLGPHLHLQVSHDGTAIDPLPLLR